jgi:hypothetical protein
LGRQSRRKRNRPRQPDGAGERFRDALEAIERAEGVELARRLAHLTRGDGPTRVMLVHLVAPPGKHSCIACWEFTTMLSTWTSQGCADWGLPGDVRVVALIPLCDVCESLYNSGATAWPAGVESDIETAVMAELRREGLG